MFLFFILLLLLLFLLAQTRLNVIKMDLKVNVRVIRNQIEIDEGDPFNQILYSKSLNNIKALGITDETFQNAVVNAK